MSRKTRSGGVGSTDWYNAQTQRIMGGLGKVPKSMYWAAFIDNLLRGFQEGRASKRKATLEEQKFQREQKWHEDEMALKREDIQARREEKAVKAQEKQQAQAEKGAEKVYKNRENDYTRIETPEIPELANTSGSVLATPNIPPEVDMAMAGPSRYQTPQGDWYETQSVGATANRMGKSYSDIAPFYEGAASEAFPPEAMKAARTESAQRADKTFSQEMQTAANKRAELSNSISMAHLGIANQNLKRSIENDARAYADSMMKLADQQGKFDQFGNFKGNREAYNYYNKLANDTLAQLATLKGFTPPAPPPVATPETPIADEKSQGGLAGLIGKLFTGGSTSAAPQKGKAVFNPVTGKIEYK